MTLRTQNGRHDMILRPQILFEKPHIHLRVWCSTTVVRVLLKMCREGRGCGLNHNDGTVASGRETDNGIGRER